MPTYAYACSECDHRFEVRQSFSDAALSECPQCSGSVRKLFNTVGIVFKGSGFYRTDSRGSVSKDDGNGTSTEKSDKPASDKPASDKPASDKPASDKPSTSSSSSATSSSSDKKPAAAGAGSAA